MLLFVFVRSAPILQNGLVNWLVSFDSTVSPMVAFLLFMPLQMDCVFICSLYGSVISLPLAFWIGFCAVPQLARSTVDNAGTATGNSCNAGTKTEAARSGSCFPARPLLPYSSLIHFHLPRLLGHAGSRIFSYEDAELHCLVCEKGVFLGNRLCHIVRTTIQWHLSLEVRECFKVDIALPFIAVPLRLFQNCMLHLFSLRHLMFFDFLGSLWLGVYCISDLFMRSDRQNAWGMLHRNL